MGEPTRESGQVARAAIAVAAVAALAGEAAAGHTTAIDAPRDVLPAIRRALDVLPRRPARVSVVGEAYVAADLRARFRRAEAFVAPGRPVVYLTSHSKVLRAAARGAPDNVYALAAVIWHEMAHLDGADEAEARRREEDLWRQFLLDHRVNLVSGLRYLKTLNDRPRVAVSAPPSP